MSLHANCQQAGTCEFFGMDSWCKPCRRSYNKAWREANPERQKAASAKWYWKDPEDRRARVQAWRKANADKVTAYRKRKYKEDPGKANKYTMEWRKRNKHKTEPANRDWFYRTRYGITLQDYDRMLAEQKGVCFGCLKQCPTGMRLAVDHDHKTGVVRGLACANCNGAQGLCKDDPAILRRLADKLELHAPI